MKTRPSLAAAAPLAAAVLLAGCGSTAAPPQQAAAMTSQPPLSLATSGATATGTWAEVVMGGSAAQHNNFWQLFALPSGSTRWALVTPPGTADNGGLVLASAGPSLITGFRPSQDLTFSPLSSTTDNGHVWSSDNPLDAALTAAPDALAAAPASHNLLALLTNGAIEQAPPGYTTWTTLTSRRALAATSPGRACGLRELTAVSYTSSGTPLAAGACSRPGITGIFADTGGTWQPAGPALPAALIREHVTVLRLTQTATQTVALLAASSGRTASLVAAWSANAGQHWTLSPALALSNAAVTTASFGATGTVAVIMTGGHADTVTAGAGHWRALPGLPRGTATLVPGAGGVTDAFSVHQATLTVWQIKAGSGSWATTQTINVPIQYGSSG